MGTQNGERVFIGHIITDVNGNGWRW
jgi:hypothetical protein